MFNNFMVIVSSLFALSGFTSSILLDSNDSFSLWLYSHIVTIYWFHEVLFYSTNLLFEDKNKDKSTIKFKDGIKLRICMVSLNFLLSAIMKSPEYQYYTSDLAYYFVKYNCYVNMFIFKTILLVSTCVYFSIFYVNRWYDFKLTEDIFNQKEESKE